MDGTWFRDRLAVRKTPNSKKLVGFVGTAFPRDTHGGGQPNSTKTLPRMRGATNATMWGESTFVR